MLRSWFAPQVLTRTSLIALTCASFLCQTYREVKGMCVLAEFLQKPLLQTTVGFPLLGHRGEGLGRVEDKRTEDALGNKTSLQQLWNRSYFYATPTWKVEMYRSFLKDKPSTSRSSRPYRNAQVNVTKTGGRKSRSRKRGFELTNSIRGYIGCLHDNISGWLKWED